MYAKRLLLNSEKRLAVTVDLQLPTLFICHLNQRSQVYSNPQAFRKIAESLRSSRITALPLLLAASRSSRLKTPVHTPMARAPPYSAALISFGCSKSTKRLVRKVLNGDIFQTRHNRSDHGYHYNCQKSNIWLWPLGRTET